MLRSKVVQRADTWVCTYEWINRPLTITPSSQIDYNIPMLDLAMIFTKAGDGGNGAATFRREKYAPKGGPDGGDGGNGGSVYLIGDANLRTLDYFASHQKFNAQQGENGRKRRQDGAKGEDLYIKVPLGTVVWQVENPVDSKEALIALSKELRAYSEDNQQPMRMDQSPVGEILEDGDVIKVAQGGRGGLGNENFKSPTNQAPEYAQKGKPGEEKWLVLELKLLADIGFIGLPNVGKSTLLSVLTAARPKIADYHFTTLSPNLGVMKTSNGKELVLADIPGLIEGASKGKGLGHEFLRHVERCRLLVHVLAPSPEFLTDTEQLITQMQQDYHTIRAELKAYTPRLIEKPEIIAVNKIDIINSEQQQQIEKAFKTKVWFISAATQTNIDQLTTHLIDQTTTD